MTSTIAWLDTDADEQRRIREMIALFSQRESRDELGLGQIRDVFSDTLFPGTSVVQTRARYFLIVPWVFVRASVGRDGVRLLDQAAYLERRLIEHLRQTQHLDGLIGRVAGKNVKILPSSIYWSGLRAYRILTAERAPDALAAAVTGRSREAEEMVDRVIGDWDPTLPPPPPGFPDTLQNGLDLLPAEADWLRERIIRSAPGTLLAHLLEKDAALDQLSEAAWTDPAAVDAPEPIRGQLKHAELFSLVMHGPALLYNLLVAEEYEKAGHTRVEGPVATYREAYGEWSEHLNAQGTDLQTWDRASFWSHVRTANPRVAPRTQAFVEAWTSAVLEGRAEGGADDPALRGLVAAREQSIKRTQSRLTNRKLLGSWAGESGSGAMVYRWPQVRRMITDVHEGRRQHAGA